MVLNVDQITIPKAFTDAKCKREKIDRAKNYIQTHGDLEKPIVVNANNVLMDGYARYLAACELKLKTVECSRQEQFIHGVFPNNPKKFVWVNKNHIPLRVGDRVIVENKDNSFAEVLVSKIFERPLNEAYPPRKKVLRKVTAFA